MKGHIRGKLDSTKNERVNHGYPFLIYPLIMRLQSINKH